MEEITLLAKLGEYQYMAKLIKDGELYLRPMSDFAKMDSVNGIGDKYENVTSYVSPKNPSIKIQLKDGREIPLSESSKITYVEHDCCDFLIYSMVMIDFIKTRETLKLKHPDELNKIGSGYDTLVIIYDHNEFIKRIKQAINNQWSMECRPVNYYPEKDIVLKELGPFDKRESYANQKEFRFCFECNINIPYSLKIGNLEDIAQIVQAKPV
ncbi:hypothetical protein [Culturomica massiliensis]|uniref:hypothetical protein n=1 Tax=Culturomica massiliensis TaxID=1841857 RepID=UPI00083861BC|nr:hypothetical protein [Culturomica massiliensis]